jgi:hypothetical protein
MVAWLGAFLVVTRFSVLLHPLDLLLHPGLLLVAGFFPVGLSGFFELDLESSFYAWLIFGWSAYIVLCVVALRQCQTRTYLLVYSALCALLALNVVGCHIMRLPAIHRF